MIKFPSIESFRHLRKRIELRATYTGRDEYENPLYCSLADVTLPVLSFRGSAKLHGTNGGVRRYPGGTFDAQGRNRVLTLEEDNYNFAKVVHNDVPAEVWEQIFQTIFSKEDLEHSCVLFGEVCGKGVQSKVGICTLDRMFVIFAARVHRVLTCNEDNGYWVSLVDTPEASSPEHRIFNVFHFPLFEITIDFNDCEKAQEKLTELTVAVENSCPVSAGMGVADGVGEGIVWQCLTPGFESSQYWFKTKGEKHKGSSNKTKIEVDAVKVANVAAFVEQTVTEARCLQGVDFLVEMGHDVSKKSTGAYLKWVGGDVFKEDYDVLEASGLSRKDVGGPVADFARKWFFEYLDKN